MNKNKLNGNLILIVIMCVVLIGIIYFFINRNSTPVQDPTGYKNTTYIIDGNPATLVGGVSVVPAAPDSASTITTQYFGNQASGDLNGDGLSDVAFILTQNTGGSGTFYYVVVGLQTSTGYQGTNAVLLGDRISPQSTQIQNGLVVVNYADRKTGDPMTTAPSVGVSKYLKVAGVTLSEVPNPNTAPVTYKNNDYGFTFTLPADWDGYTIVKNTWNGNNLVATTTKQTGVTLLIRNPKWTSATHYEDIPVMVFTIAQWNSYAAGNYAVSAAPISATELGRNNRYVFALPPRWDFDYSLGYQEAESIVQSNPLHPFNL